MALIVGCTTAAMALLACVLIRSRLQCAVSGLVVVAGCPARMSNRPMASRLVQWRDLPLPLKRCRSSSRETQGCRDARDRMVQPARLTSTDFLQLGFGWGCRATPGSPPPYPCSIHSRWSLWSAAGLWLGSDAALLVSRLRVVGVALGLCALGVAALGFVVGPIGLAVVGGVGDARLGVVGAVKALPECGAFGLIQLCNARHSQCDQHHQGDPRTRSPGVDPRQ